MSFEELLVGELGWLARLSRHYHKSKADAEDLLGETVLKLIENKNRYNRECPFRPWAKTVMENTYITSYNRSRCVLFTSMEYDCTVCDRTPDKDVDTWCIVDTIERLAKKSLCVEALRLYACEGFRYDEVADIMGVGIEVIKTRILTGRKIIKRALRIYKN